MIPIMAKFAGSGLSTSQPAAESKVSDMPACKKYPRAPPVLLTRRTGTALLGSWQIVTVRRDASGIMVYGSSGLTIVSGSSDAVLDFESVALTFPESASKLTG